MINVSRFVLYLARCNSSSALDNTFAPIIWRQKRHFVLPASKYFWIQRWWNSLISVQQHIKLYPIWPFSKNDEQKKHSYLVIFGILSPLIAPFTWMKNIVEIRRIADFWRRRSNVVSWSSSVTDRNEWSSCIYCSWSMLYCSVAFLRRRRWSLYMLVNRRLSRCNPPISAFFCVIDSCKPVFSCRASTRRACF